MTEVHQLQRVLGSRDGKTRIVIPVRTFQSRAEALEAKAKFDHGVKVSMAFRIFRPTGDGEGQDMGSLAQYLKDIGLEGFVHVVEDIEVESIIQAPQSSIVMP